MGSHITSVENDAPPKLTCPPSGLKVIRKSNSISGMCSLLNDFCYFLLRDNPTTMSSNQGQATMAGAAAGLGAGLGSGALIGAGIGNIVPGVGTIAGAVIGAGVGMAAGSLVGAISGNVSSRQAEKGKRSF